jgi:hypothetical protein
MASISRNRHSSAGAHPQTRTTAVRWRDSPVGWLSVVTPRVALDQRTDLAIRADACENPPRCGRSRGLSLNGWLSSGWAGPEIKEPASLEARLAPRTRWRLKGRRPRPAPSRAPVRNRRPRSRRAAVSGPSARPDSGEGRELAARRRPGRVRGNRLLLPHPLAEGAHERSPTSSHHQHRPRRERQDVPAPACRRRRVVRPRRDPRRPGNEPPPDIQRLRPPAAIRQRRRSVLSLRRSAHGDECACLCR